MDGKRPDALHHPERAAGNRAATVLPAGRRLGLGDGWVQIEFHNDDTDDWDPGAYDVEMRFDVAPVWTGTPPTGRCEDALTAGVEIIEGSIVRTAIHSTLTIEEVYGKI